MTLEPARVVALVEQARDDDAPLQQQHDAFTQLVQQSQHIVFALALSMLRNAADAEDVAQDAFALAWRRLRQLRDPAAFEAWLKSIVVRQCRRRQRQRQLASETMALPAAVNPEAPRLDYQDVIAAAMTRLPAGERDVTVMFYFLGYSQPQIARLLSLKEGTVGKRLHSARLRIRRALPRSVRNDFVRHRPSAEFATRVRRGLLDDYVGQYRFERRPDHLVSIFREGDSLVSDAGNQRHVLLSLDDDSLVTREYDGEGRFRRSRRGDITHFVYYEFGRRLGVARKISGD
ncbi:MAG: RNA polymerase sigma factor [Gemmatimonadaceae bacterium]